MKLKEVQQLPLFPDIHIEPLDWDEIKLVPLSEDIHQVAQANMSGDDYEVQPLKMYPIHELLDGVGQDYYARNPQESKRVKALAEQIKYNKWFEPLIIARMDIPGEDDEPWIVEGQHRARAVELFNTKVIPAYLIEYFETE